MIAWLTAGLVMGAVGSLHCIGMCGSLALSLPVVHPSNSSRFFGSLLYNSGRIFTYALLGVLLGSFGYSFVLLGLQQWLTIGIGIGMLVFLFLPPRYKNTGKNLSFLAPLRMRMGRLYTQPNYLSLFNIGLLNGMLPCGLVYAALAIAVAGGNIFTSALFMAAFGAGTLPMMWMVAFFGSSMKLNFRLRLRKAYPYVVFLMACLLILRGLNLGIPFISPAVHSSHDHAAAINCHD